MNNKKTILVLVSRMVPFCLLLFLKERYDSGNLKITNLDRLIFTKNGELTI